MCIILGIIQHAGIFVAAGFLAGAHTHPMTLKKHNIINSVCSLLQSSEPALCVTEAKTKRHEELTPKEFLKYILPHSSNLTIMYKENAEKNLVSIGDTLERLFFVSIFCVNLFCCFEKLFKHVCLAYIWKPFILYSAFLHIFVQLRENCQKCLLEDGISESWSLS